MVQGLKNFRHSLVFKLILAVGMTLLLTISAWAYFNIKYQKEKLMNNILAGTDKLTNTIKLGTHYAMMLNSRDDINQIINNIAKQPEFENIPAPGIEVGGEYLVFLKNFTGMPMVYTNFYDYILLFDYSKFKLDATEKNISEISELIDSNK